MIQYSVYNGFCGNVPCRVLALWETGSKGGIKGEESLRLNLPPSGPPVCPKLLTNPSVLRSPLGIDRVANPCIVDFLVESIHARLSVQEG
jgi:hypothetical protein